MTHGDADLVVAEAGLLEIGDGLVGVAAVLEDTDDGRALLGDGHGVRRNHLPSYP